MTTTTPLRVDPAAAARFFRVLGDPTRLRILDQLESGERSVGQIVAAVGLPQARVSSHLACLRHCGLAVAERRGKEVYYRLAIGGVATVLATAGAVIEPLVPALSTCTRIGPDWI